MSTTTRTITLVLAALAVAIGGYLVLRPDDDPEPKAVTTTVTTSAAGTTTTTATTTTAPAPTVTRIRLKDGKPVGGEQAIEVRKGDRVRLVVTSDAAGEIHVHGYDLEREAAPGSPARFDFVADIDGRFEVEAHATDTRIAEITVNP